MRKSSKRLSVSCLVVSGSLACAGAGLAADTLVIGTQGISWTYKEKKSTPAAPLVVDELKIADIVEVKIAGAIPHGIVTIKRSGGGPPVEDKSPVLACGEDSSAKPNAVLRELDCGAASKFGVAFTGSMRLEVMNTFKEPVDFYCVIHHAGMAGTLKLQP
jgi:hypothetical protein